MRIHPGNTQLQTWAQELDTRVPGNPLSAMPFTPFVWSITVVSVGKLVTNWATRLTPPPPPAG